MAITQTNTRYGPTHVGDYRSLPFDIEVITIPAADLTDENAFLGTAIDLSPYSAVSVFVANETNKSFAWGIEAILTSTDEPTPGTTILASATTSTVTRTGKWVFCRNGYVGAGAIPVPYGRLYGKLSATAGATGTATVYIIKYL